ncbi:hypothetical protein LCGC14_2534350 [marine sediment metagenome]|uniref:Uncharacterized protein n=1 Tax=marine sediment metagenome TaxID=412755 RepID=A0A0F9DKN1_9ZZZZ
MKTIEDRAVVTVGARVEVLASGRLGTVERMDKKSAHLRMEDGAEVQRVMGMLVGKYPNLSEMPPNENYVVFRVAFKEGVFIDNMQGFGNRDSVSY